MTRVPVTREGFLSDLGHFIPVYEAVLQHPDLTHLDAHVHGFLCRYRMTTGKMKAYPSQRTIAFHVGANADSIRKSLHRLRDVGLVHFEANADGQGRQTTNSYYPLYPSECHRAVFDPAERERVAGQGAATTFVGGPPAGVPGGTPAGQPVTHKEIRKEEIKSATADDGLGSVKPPYRSVATTLRELFSKASPNATYRFSKSDGGILKKLWDDVDDLHQAAQVFAAAGVRRSSDPFWAQNWSPRFLLGQISKLLNTSEGAAPEKGEVDEQERVREAAWAGAVLAARNVGVPQDRSEPVLRDAGFGPEHVQELRRLVAILDTPYWRQRLLEAYSLSRPKIFRECVEKYAPGRGDAAPADGGSRGAAGLF